MVIKILLTVVVYIIIHYVGTQRASGCSINLPKKDDKLQPILLKNRTKTLYDFYIPNGKPLNLENRDSLTFLCSSNGNKIVGSNTNITSCGCFRGESLICNRKNTVFDNIKCESYVKASVLPTNTKCGNNLGRIAQIGFQVTRTQFLPVIQTCYDRKSQNSLYSNHTVYGKAMSERSHQSFRPPFFDDTLPHDLKPYRLYTQQSQKNVLQSLLRSGSIVTKYYSKNQFLSRGHLAPDADFIFAPMQFATYFFINICPQWQSINSGNWLIVENMVRKAAGKLKVELQVYTGTHELLSLPDADNYEVDIYLDGKNNIPVPKYIWKIVYNEITKQGIAFITVNNPFLIEIYDDEILCPDICDRYYWGNHNFQNFSKGYTFCCEVSYLRKVVRTIPYINVRDIELPSTNYMFILDCKFQLPKTDDKFQPILLIDKQNTLYEFYLPNINSNGIKQLTFLCSPLGNKIETFKINLTSCNCLQEELLTCSNRNVSFNTINCQNYVKASVLSTNTKCGNTGQLFYIGFQVTKLQYLPLIHSCYDRSEERSLYSIHTVHGQAMLFHSQQQFRPPFSEEALPKSSAVNMRYTKKNQLNVFEKLLGSKPLAEKYFKKNDFLSRGHLAPDADFIFAPMQFATYFFINAAPQWQSMNAGNWLTIENMVRKLAQNLKEDLYVYTGTHDLLTLPDVNNNKVGIYLDGNNRTPVPRYFWKVVYNEKTKKGIAFVALNNPLLDSVNSDELICPNVCSKYNWNHRNFENYAKGYTFCCEVPQLQNVVRTIPHINVHGVLTR
ncbi:hypothetical protein FQA39_LY13136 [Lamprigera yunnana]|nr:hypothetical protein FQA39_LY13136 [Lamprigera yunnana]